MIFRAVLVFEGLVGPCRLVIRDPRGAGAGGESESGEGGELLLPDFTSPELTVDAGLPRSLRADWEEASVGNTGVLAPLAPMRIVVEDKYGNKVES